MITVCSSEDILSNAPKNEVDEQITSKLPELSLDHSMHNVIVSNWISPHDFSVQLSKHSDDIHQLSIDIMAHYENKEGIPLKHNLDAGAMVVVRHDELFHRAKILAHNPKVEKFKVVYYCFFIHF